MQLTIKVGAGCGDLLQELYLFGKEFHERREQYPLRTAQNVELWPAWSGMCGGKLGIACVLRRASLFGI